MFLVSKITIIVLVSIFIVLLIIFGAIQLKMSKKEQNKDVESVNDGLNEVLNIDIKNSINEKKNSEMNETELEMDPKIEPSKTTKNVIKDIDDVKEKKTQETFKVQEESKVNNTEIALSNEEIVQNKRKGKYEIFKDSGFYRYRLKASNGEILIESELYETEKAVNEAVEIVRKNVENGIYQIVEDKNDSYQYKLSSRNHRTLVVSTSYSTKKGAEDAKDAFRRNALTDIVVVLKETKKVSKGSMEIYTDASSVLDDKGLYEVIPNGKKFYFTLKNSKGIVICKSDDYVSKTSCITGLESFRNVVYDGVFYICKDKNGKFQYKLYNKQNKLVVSGELLETKAKVQTVIRHVRRFAKLSKLG